PARRPVGLRGHAWHPQAQVPAQSADGRNRAQRPRGSGPGFLPGRGDGSAGPRRPVRDRPAQGRPRAGVPRHQQGGPGAQAAPVAGGCKRGGKLARISATVYVEKKSQKAIVIGKQGAMLKAVGTYARIDMEHLFGMKVFLQLWVKVKEAWRQDERMLVELGY